MSGMEDGKDLFGSLAEVAARHTAPRSDAGEPSKADSSRDPTSYTAADIEVLEGLEPVRRRPGMYIGGTDEKALHHLFAEVIDNSMDEAVAGHATFIAVDLDADGTLSVTDNGRGIPVDPHPKFPGKSALEVIFTTLHSGGKFSDKAYQTSGGLHGVGISVVNALSDRLEVEVARNQRLYRQTYSRGHAQSALVEVGAVNNRRGTRIKFHPDETIFGVGARFKPSRLFTMARSKAYLFGGVEIRWNCAPELLGADSPIPDKATFHYAGGLKDYLGAQLEGDSLLADGLFFGKVKVNGGPEAVEWAIGWLDEGDSFVRSYCNTIPTPEGGTHEQGLRASLLRGLRAYGDLIGNKKVKDLTSDDVMGVCCAMLSVFVREPEFQGQTKERLATSEAARIVDQAMRDPFDHWLAKQPQTAKRLLDKALERADERLRRRAEKETLRKTATRKLRLPGKLADCSQDTAKGAELFIVEGDSAGGSAKQARQRQNQAILPLRGKILNVASAADGKLAQNQQLADLVLALGSGTRTAYREEDLRYERIIIMTDADVDGAHIASLLLTFFFREMPELIRGGHLFLAVPPLYRLTYGGKTVYARDDAEKNDMVAKMFKNKNVEIGRFKGLGEMMPQQLRETTMDPKKRILLRVVVDEELRGETKTTVEELMGTKPETRFRFIQDRAAFVQELDV